jgi:hypothetical protein
MYVSQHSLVTNRNWGGYLAFAGAFLRSIISEIEEETWSFVFNFSYLYFFFSISWNTFQYFVFHKQWLKFSEQLLFCKPHIQHFSKLYQFIFNPRFLKDIWEMFRFWKMWNLRIDLLLLIQMSYYQRTHPIKNNFIQSVSLVIRR